MPILANAAAPSPALPKLKPAIEKPLDICPKAVSRLVTVDAIASSVGITDVNALSAPYTLELTPVKLFTSP